MKVPVSEMVSVTSYVLKQRLRGRKRFPLVLMLEPLYRCNLACAGCGKIQYPSQVLRSQLSVEECLSAVAQADTPVVALPGGEPLLHPEIHEIVAKIVEQKKYVHLCTNGLLLEEKLGLFEPSRYLTFTVHMDGLEEEHDFAVCREGTYRTAVRAIRAALERGFRVTTNTTLFEGADPERTRAFFDEMMRLGIEGMMVSPGYSYEKAPDQEHFLAKDRTRNLFRRILRESGKRWHFTQSPLFIEFLAGGRDYECTPWGMPTYSVFGWQKPCYLLQEGYERSFDDLIEKTPWEDYGPGSGNPKCANCMVHSGFEASAVMEAFSSWRGLGAMARAFLFGPRVPAPSLSEPAPFTQPVVVGSGGLSRGDTAEATPAVLRQAFDYRGDVTLTLDDGTALEGYVANLSETQLALWHRGATAAESVDTARVRRVAFSGRDTAEGRSFETWLREWEDTHGRRPGAVAGA